MQLFFIAMGCEKSCSLPMGSTYVDIAATLYSMTYGMLCIFMACLTPVTACLGSVSVVLEAVAEAVEDAVLISST